MNNETIKIKEDLSRITTSQMNLSRALKLTQPRINAMIKQGIVIRDDSDKSGGVYILESLRNYYSRHAMSDEDAEVDINRERALHERAKRQLAELKLEKARGSVYDARIVERVITEDLVKLRTRLLTLPSKLAPIIEGKARGEIDHLLTREIEETLSELSRYDPSVFISDEIEDEDES